MREREREKKKVGLYCYK